MKFKKKTCDIPCPPWDDEIYYDDVGGGEGELRAMVSVTCYNTNCRWYAEGSRCSKESIAIGADGCCFDNEKGGRRRG